MLGSRRPVPPSADGFRPLDAHSDVLIPERLRRELLIERDDERQREDAKAHPPQTPADARRADRAPAARSARARARPGQARLPLYDIATVQAALSALPAVTRGNDRHALEQALLKKLAQGDPLRRVATPGRAGQQQLQRLREQFPNFADVLDAVERAIAWARCTGDPFVLPPMLLVGQPGVGKSLFVEQLTLALIGQRAHRVQAETSGIADKLTGTERHWSSSGPGEIFQLLVGGDLMNPIIMIDELEKAPQRREHAGLVKVLYSLLEPDSASRFRDQSLPEVPLDASHVGWIATANRVEPIEAPLLDRMQVFHINAPAPEQALGIVRGMESKLLQRCRRVRPPSLPPDMLEQVAQLPPRRAGKLLPVLLGNLARRRATSFGAQEQALLQAELKAVTERGRAGAERALTEAEVLQGILTLSTVAAMKAIEITGKQAWAQQLRPSRGSLH